ncbi:hypothetical protein MPTK1_4g12560 [Marchantia polymorpha subsp. ruderalis]|uniref:Uncharacterized protein n=2 Tax=Marchantia polymorpha TaxID=3197 RepID=A0AAF6B981_MARPO|nr:hypothetical protein MARPO_0174s0018 [Marchantia polymorpha]BBN08565.1 hypothetical protein Mp_4g12560 [Marchantia polymorpha subsp. ruderalis]|eukprot:PTQ28091.1 hypothetical protein MARPO_0174s0018 [Marchantia polymorpha]
MSEKTLESLKLMSLQTAVLNLLLLVLGAATLKFSRRRGRSLTLTQDSCNNDSVFLPLLNPCLRKFMYYCREAKEARRS